MHREQVIDHARAGCPNGIGIMRKMQYLGLVLLFYVLCSIAVVPDIWGRAKCLLKATPVFYAKRHYKRTTSPFFATGDDYYYGMVVFVRLADEELENCLKKAS